LRAVSESTGAAGVFLSLVEAGTVGVGLVSAACDTLLIAKSNRREKRKTPREAAGISRIRNITALR
jgi:hypothetical protein